MISRNKLLIAFLLLLLSSCSYYFLLQTNGNTTWPIIFQSTSLYDNTSRAWSPLSHGDNCTKIDDVNGSDEHFFKKMGFFSNQSNVTRVPTVPAMSIDRGLLVLSASASRVRYGTSVTFVMVFPSDVETVLRRKLRVKPMPSRDMNLWCIFDDGSMKPGYGSDIRLANERVSLLDCALSDFASKELWLHNRTLRVYLASRQETGETTPLLKAFITVPIFPRRQSNSQQLSLTLCTSPLHNQDRFLIQWIEFHRLVGFTKFVIYNSTDERGRLLPIINNYARKYPNSVEVVQWNFRPLHLRDWKTTRYFQLEALHDCLIRYGDQSDWIGTIDLDEYIVPLTPYQTIEEYLRKRTAHHAIGSIRLFSLFFCDEQSNQLSAEPMESNALVIEKFTVRAKARFEGGRQKYLYRPRFVQHLSIHKQIHGLPPIEASANDVQFAHYVSMSRSRSLSFCGKGNSMVDTSVRDRFSKNLRASMKYLSGWTMLVIHKKESLLNLPIFLVSIKTLVIWRKEVGKHKDWFHRFSRTDYQCMIHD